MDECELSKEEQLFHCQLELEKVIKTDCDIEKCIFKYLDNIKEKQSIVLNDFGKDLEWLNVGESLSLHNNLQGLLVVLDFFTYCCVNCLHILPLLNHIEKEYENEGVIVVGIHSPKFNNERDIGNVSDAVLRHNINHPVVNDPNAGIWSSLSVQCWPTLIILGPNSQLLFTLVGENGIQDWLQLYITTAHKYFSQRNMIIKENKAKLPINLLKNNLNCESVQFPTKINVSTNGKLLAISDTYNHRIIVSQINGQLEYMIGGNESGFKNGSLSEALFNRPQGIVWKNSHIIYVADTENHAIRMIDLENKRVITLAGNGKQCVDKMGGNIGTEQGLNSPWDVSYDMKDKLFIAMAGSHQIWVLCLQNNAQIYQKLYPEGYCVCFAGNGIEENRNNIYPYKACFAQPSGLAIDTLNDMVYVADSESSSVRSIDIRTGTVKAVVGGDRNPLNLFAFGDRDGRGIDCRLQHCIGIAFDKCSQSLFLADSYNHKIKQISISSKECITIAGFGVKGNQSNCKLIESSFNEPNGLCLINDSRKLLVTDTNNHCIKCLDLENDFVTQLQLIRINKKVISFPQNMINEEDIDFTININSCDFSINNELELRLNLTFGQTIKLTNGAQNLLILHNPEQSLFNCNEKQLQFDNTEDMPCFKIFVINKTSIELFSTSYPFIVYAFLNLCDLNLNFCKQIKIAFRIEVVINKSEVKNSVHIELPFHIEQLKM